MGSDPLGQNRVLVPPVDHEVVFDPIPTQPLSRIRVDVVEPEIRARGREPKLSVHRLTNRSREFGCSLVSGHRPLHPSLTVCELDIAKHVHRYANYPTEPIPKALASIIPFLPRRHAEVVLSEGKEVLMVSAKRPVDVKRDDRPDNGHTVRTAYLSQDDPLGCRARTVSRNASWTRTPFAHLPNRPTRITSPKQLQVCQVGLIPRNPSRVGSVVSVAS